MQARGVEADVVTCCSLISALERGGQWQLAEVRVAQPQPAPYTLLAHLGADMQALAQRLGACMHRKPKARSKRSSMYCDVGTCLQCHANCVHSALLQHGTQHALSEHSWLREVSGPDPAY